MSRRTEKQLAQLDELEAEFQLRLVKSLEQCADGRHSLLFFVSSMRPEHWPPSVRSDDADELFATAGEILGVRAQHGLDDDCLAARYREACRRYIDHSDHQRLGARRQAQRMLRELGDHP